MTDELHITVGCRDNRPTLAMLRQRGCLKARFPAPQDPAWIEAIVLNNSGGVVGGDSLSTHLHVAGGARAILTTASAEKIYRQGDDAAVAVIRNSVDVAQDACAEWLPQETILFDGCALDRALVVEMHGSASLLGAEMVVFGRVASGESVRRAIMRDLIRVSRDGRVVLHDAWLPPEDFGAGMGRRATAGGARCMATLFFVQAQAGRKIDVMRAVLDGHAGVESGASCWDGMLVVRLLSADPACLRVVVAALLHSLRDGRMLPRVWAC